MASEVSIINQALRLIGEKTINSRADSVKAARIADAEFDTHRDFVLTQHLWSFAKTRVELAASATAPEWGPDVAYTLPADFLHPVYVNNEDVYSGRWAVEGETIATDLSAPLKLLYIARIEDSDKFSPGFINCLAHYCAWKWADTIRGSREKAAEMEGLYRKLLDEARGIDSRKKTPEVQEATEWIDARLGSNTRRRESDLGFDGGTY